MFYKVQGGHTPAISIEVAEMVASYPAGQIQNKTCNCCPEVCPEMDGKESG